MAYVPHLRMSLLGRLGGVNGLEQFSCSISLGKRTAIDSPLLWVGGLEPNDDVWEDLADDAAAWFGREGTQISDEAVLTSVKFAAIGADGLYTHAPVEKARQVAGFYSAGRVPNQVARAVTLHTAGDLGRIKGRFYSPLPGMPVGVDGRFAADTIAAAQASDETFIEALNNQPGFDVLDIHVVVASQGRRNKNGTVRLGPGNHKVTGLSVGRVPDTIRRRRNKLQEARSVVAIT